MSPFFFSEKVKVKVKELHDVEIQEVREAFYNRNADFDFNETRIEHLRENEKWWFISETDTGRLLKVVIGEDESETLDLVTAYDPDEEDLKYYEERKKEKSSRG